ncbi:DUF192 domain-containing protein [Endomicrobium proavitum]|uniref:DUF192 domain-containing protein n=1 Tax=Endomicrobium proavitum TaxID=1408281 RepID=A0A0G3WI57_9BACT|nr:DUF192 domain-containing protein [Endomicrobium proavitum]AKL97973.1 conserved exported protein of unknown function [Endomicrobium proavitum]
MKKIFLTMLLFSIAAAACADTSNKNKTFSRNAQDNSILEVKLAGANLKLFTVKSPEAKRKGLSGRDTIPNDGMIFFFDYPSPLAFWMKDMKFAIDIIWINADKVVSVTKNAQPQPGAKDDKLKIYSPAFYADTVIELSAGDADKYNIEAGSAFTIRRIIND